MPVYSSSGAVSKEPPTGSAYRIYERLPSGGKKFLTVVFVFAVTDSEAAFRYAGSRKTETVERRVWNNWAPEPVTNFKPRLHKQA